MKRGCNIPPEFSFIYKKMAVHRLFCPFHRLIWDRVAGLIIFVGLTK